MPSPSIEARRRPSRRFFEEPDVVDITNLVPGNTLSLKDEWASYAFVVEGLASHHGRKTPFGKLLIFKDGNKVIHREVELYIATNSSISSQNVVTEGSNIGILDDDKRKFISIGPVRAFSVQFNHQRSWSGIPK